MARRWKRRAMLYENWEAKMDAFILLSGLTLFLMFVSVML
jgi:hypothetical protein